MAIEIIIKNKSAKKELPSIDVLTGGKFKYGSFDGVRLNMEQKGPDGSISMFNPERIGRGMSVGFGDNEISLFLPLPSSAEEIAEKMDGMTPEKVREIQKISLEPVSLETPIGEEEDSHLGDFIQDDNVPVPAEAAASTLLKEQLVEVLGTLTEREQKVLRLRFGMDDGRARTLEEVGREFNVTRERIRQIEAKALRKLRHPSRSRKLKDYLD